MTKLQSALTRLTLTLALAFPALSFAHIERTDQTLNPIFVDKNSQNKQTNTSDVKIETTVIQVTDPQDVSEVRSEILTEISSQTKENPDLNLSIKIGHTEGEKTPSEVLGVAHAIQNLKPDTKVVEEPLKKEVVQKAQSKVLQILKDNYIVSFSLIRWIVNGTVTGIAVSISPLPAEVATHMNFIIVGTSVGAFSAALMYYNQLYLEWLITPSRMVEKLRKLDNKVYLNVGQAKFTTASVVEKLEYFSKWYVLEVGFLGLTNLVELALGMDHFSKSMVTGTLLTGIYSLGAQGVWEIGIGIQKDRMARLGLDENKLRFKTDLAVLALSGISVGLAIANMQEVPHAGTAMAALSAAGFLNLFRLYVSRPKPLACNTIFAL